MYYVKQDNYVYQITDHLGNVRATIADTKVSSSAVVLSYADYYPFGMTMAGRNMAASPEYRLAYQGQEIDKEVGGAGFYAFELRHYDARLGKWLSADPYEQHWSPYLAMSNNPISFIDPDGGWSVFTHQQEYLQALGEYTWANSNPSYANTSGAPWFMWDRNAYGFYVDGEFNGMIDMNNTSLDLVQEGTFMYIIGRNEVERNTSRTKLFLNGTTTLQIGISVIRQEYEEHVVKDGEYPELLAAKYGTDVWTIAELNQKKDGNKGFFKDIYANSGGDYGKYWEEGKGTEWMIYPGDVLTIPDNRPGAKTTVVSPSKPNKKSNIADAKTYQDRYDVLINALGKIQKDIDEGKKIYLKDYLDYSKLPGGTPGGSYSSGDKTTTYYRTFIVRKGENYIRVIVTRHQKGVGDAPIYGLVEESATDKPNPLSLKSESLPQMDGTWSRDTRLFLLEFQFMGENASEFKNEFINDIFNAADEN